MDRRGRGYIEAEDIQKKRTYRMRVSGAVEKKWEQLFELLPEGIIGLLVLCFFGGLGIVFDEIIVRLLRR